MRSVPLPGTRFSAAEIAGLGPVQYGVHDSPAERPKTHLRRRRYAGKNPREYHEKYKELNSAQYPGEVEKILAAGKTPAGMHLPIMVDEVLECLRPVGGQ